MGLTPGEQFLNALRALFDQQLDGRQVVESVSCIEGALQVQADFVFITEPGGFALGIGRLKIWDFLLGKNEYTSGLRQLNGRAQPGHTGADHYEVGLGWKTLHNSENSITEAARAVIRGHTLLWERNAASDGPRNATPLPGLD